MSSETRERSIDIPALIGSRICHDLISPIGAIGNGIELLSMAGGGAGSELSLISQSVTNANARIRFYRLAFGQFARDQATGRGEVTSILKDLYSGSRLDVAWTLANDCRRVEAKAALLALQCVESAMPFGGRIEVARSDGRWRIAGAAPKFRVEPEVWALLEGRRSEPEITPALVHFALLPDTLAQMERKLTVRRDEARIVLEY